MMKPPQQFSLIPSLKRNPTLAEFEALLDILPDAALIIESKTNRILLANSKMAELSAYTRVELADMELCQVLVERESAGTGQTLNGDGTITNFILLRRNKTQVEVNLSAQYLTAKSRWKVITLQPAWQIQQREAQKSQRERMLASMGIIAQALFADDLDHTLELILDASRRLLNVDVSAVYLQSLTPEGQEVSLTRLAANSPGGGLPDKLPAQDLISLRKPQIWVAGKRPGCELHRTARSAGLAYVASAPLGQASALIGILVAAGRIPPQEEDITLQISLMAEATTALIQIHSRMSNFKAELRSQIRAQAIHEAITNAINDAVVVLSPELTILQINRAAEAVLGYTANEARGHPVEDILIGTESMMRVIRMGLEGTPTFDADDIHLYHRSGREFLAKVSVLPAQVDEHVQAVIILIQDLTEKEQIQTRTQQLEQRALLGEVTAIFAHEVRNPINNISTGLQLMAYNLPANDPHQELLSRLQQDCDRLGELMKSVLTFSRTEYEMKAIDMGALISRLLERQRPHMTNQKIQAQIQVDPQTPKVKGDHRALEQVFTNLVTNAIQALSDKGGTITVKILPVRSGGDRRYVEIDVADNGPGIPPEIQERIFQPFFTTKANGTGLGLAITKRIITAHKGTIAVSSVPGGTVFQVHLPAMEVE